MAVVLGAVGLLLYLRFESDLYSSVDQGLHSRAGDIAVILRQRDVEAKGQPSVLTAQGEGFAQIYDEQGRIVDANPRLRNRQLLTPEQLARARRHPILVKTRAPTDSPELEPARLYATPVEVRGRRYVTVVGTAVDDRRDALRQLAALLAIGGPIALLLASLAGYGVAAAALRPVERMRRRAVEITDAHSGQRLPVPDARDELRRLGETLNDMLARLEAAFARERTFVADASHELRTPLSVLKGEVELALRDGRTEEELREALRAVQSETDRLVQLAEDLLVIARSDQGKLPIRETPVRASDLFRHIGERYGRRADDNVRELRLDTDPGLELVADPLRLEQALGNLVDNALRHGAGRISLTAAERNGSVELHVTDEGPGFPASLLDSAFERFVKAEGSRSGDGAGLGLAIVAAIARAHGGRAEVANLQGGGADVWIVLPRASDQ
jgi:signal transduction histidine kinase